MSIRNILKVKIRGFRIGLGVNMVYDYSPERFGPSRFGIRPFIIPVLF
jgi:protein involved in sex pheromone biosynthesis